MIRSLILGTLLAVVAGLLSAADPISEPEEPPVRLKKKDKKAPPPPVEKEAEKPAEEPEKKRRLQDPKDEDAKPPPDMPAEDEREVLDRVLRNSRAAEERLGNKETGEATRQLQRDILKDLDSLIERSQQGSDDQQDQQDQQQGGEQGQQGQQQKGQRQQGGMSSKSGSKRQQSRTVRRRSQQKGGQQQAARGQGEQQGEQQQQPMGQGGQANQGGAGTTSPQGANKLADVYKEVWGHLPETLRAEMNAYSREKFMMKYKDLIERYYATVAEKGRKGP